MDDNDLMASQLNDISNASSARFFSGWHITEHLSYRVQNYSKRNPLYGDICPSKRAIMRNALPYQDSIMYLLTAPSHCLYHHYQWDMKSDFIFQEVYLTHWGRLTHICVSKINHRWLRFCPVAWLAPSHNLNQCWDFANLTQRNTFQWNFSQNKYISIQENSFENVVCEMAIC